MLLSLREIVAGSAVVLKPPGTAAGTAFTMTLPGEDVETESESITEQSIKQQVHGNIEIN